MLTCYRLNVSACGRLSDPEQFWHVLQTLATPVDSAPVAAHDVLEKIIDYVHSECRFRIPPGDRTDLGTPICPPDGTRVVSCLSRQDCQVLRSRIRKFQLDSTGAWSVCESYNLWDTGSREAVRQCLRLLERQREFVDSDDDRILIVAVPQAI